MSLTSLTKYCRLQVDHDHPGYHLPWLCLSKEGPGAIIVHRGTSWLVLVRQQESVRLYSVLQAIQFPGSIAHVNASLPDMDCYAFPLQRRLNDVMLGLFWCTCVVRYSPYLFYYTPLLNLIPNNFAAERELHLK